jgi:hypothetical protein
LLDLPSLAILLLLRVLVLLLKMQLCAVQVVLAVQTLLTINIVEPALPHQFQELSNLAILHLPTMPLPHASLFLCYVPEDLAMLDLLIINSLIQFPPHLHLAILLLLGALVLPLVLLLSYVQVDLVVQTLLAPVMPQQFLKSPDLRHLAMLHLRMLLLCYVPGDLAVPTLLITRSLIPVPRQLHLLKLPNLPPIAIVLLLRALLLPLALLLCFVQVDFAVEVLLKPVTILLRPSNLRSAPQLRLKPPELPHLVMLRPMDFPCNVLGDLVMQHRVSMFPIMWPIMC